MHVQTFLVDGLPPVLYTHMTWGDPIAHGFARVAQWYGLAPLAVYNGPQDGGGADGAVAALRNPPRWSALIADDATLTVRAPSTGGGAPIGPVLDLIGPVKITGPDGWCALALVQEQVLLIAGPPVHCDIATMAHISATGGADMAAGFLPVRRPAARPASAPAQETARHER